jgi:3-oxoacyl-[acyl-carrier-protein] synthase-3
MALFTKSNFKISGISACVPKNVEYNKDYKWVSEKERNDLIKRVGVEEKRVASKGITTADLCQVAAEKLIEGLGWKKEEIQLLVLVSQSRDYILPASACILQDKLGLPKSAIAFDVSMGCSGYTYGLSIVSNYVAHCGIQKALLLVGDVSSMTSYRDKTTYPLFGQAGTATAIEYSEAFDESYFNLQTDGSGHKAIMIPAGGMRNYPTKKMFEFKSFGKGIIRNDLHVALDGYAVFDFSLREVAPNVRAILAYAGKKIEDIDFFIFHQANLLINETIRKKLKLDIEKVPSSLKKYGNTSSATIPLTIVSELSEKVSTRKLKMLFCGFGVGLSWGSVILELNKIYCPPVIEFE